jgi:hypothetical protein
MEGGAIFFQNCLQSKYCEVKDCFLPKFCGPNFCKLHQKEVSRNVDEVSLPSDYQKVCQKKLFFLKFPSLHDSGCFYLLVKICIRLLTIMLLEITTVNS